jgi:hypothetical protein
MTTAATSLLGLALPVTGELSGTWGDTVNNSITSLLDSAIAGTTTLSTDADVTLSTTTLAANQARQAILLCSGARTVQRNITAPAQSKIYTVINATTGGFAVVIRGVGPTTGISVPAGQTAVVAWNGSDFVDASNYVNGNLRVNGNLTVTGTITNTAGTANGVAYLNGSKVLTTGSALVFDGTNFTTTGTTTSSGYRFSYNTGLFTTDGTLSNYSAANSVYLNGNVAGALVLNGSGNGNQKIVVQGATNSYIQFFTSNSESMRLDASGNLGLGVTPFANSLTSGALDLKNGMGLFGFGNGFNLSANAYYDTAWKYKATAAATLYTQGSGGQHQWSTAASGTAGNAIAFTQAMTLDASGALLLGTTTLPSSRKFIFEATGDNVGRMNTGGASNGLSLEFANNGTLRGGIGNGSGNITSGAAADMAIQANANLVFAAGGYGEKARIDSSGNLLVGTTTTTQGSPFTVTKNDGSTSINNFGFGGNTTVNTVDVGAGTGGALCIIRGYESNTGQAFVRLYLVCIKVPGGGGSDVSATLITSLGNGGPAFSFGSSGGKVQITSSGSPGYSTASYFGL